MPPVISFLNQKGGVGKTSLSTNVSSALALRGGRVLLVDADPQASALDWSATRERAPLFPVLALPKKTLHRELAALAEGYDYVVIDGPPRVHDVSRSVILASDLVLVPVQPSPYDVWAAEEVVGLIEEASVFAEGLSCAFVINRRIANTAIGRDVHEALSAYPVEVLASTVSQRVAFAESVARGMSVLETAPEGPAAAEVNVLVDEILAGLVGKARAA